MASGTATLIIAVLSTAALTQAVALQQLEAAAADEESSWVSGVLAEAAGGAEEGWNPHQTYLTKFMNRAMPAAATGFTAPPLKQCILTPQETSFGKCSRDGVERLHQNREAYANFHGYHLKYVDFKKPEKPWSTSKKDKCHKFWNKVDSVVAAIDDGCDLVLYMDSEVAMTNMGLEIHQFMNQTEDAIFALMEFGDSKHPVIDHGMFLVRGSQKVREALESLKTSTQCNRKGRITTGLASPHWNARVLQGYEAATFFARGASKDGKYSWHKGGFSAKLAKHSCTEMGSFLEKLSGFSAAPPDPLRLLKQMEERAEGRKY